MQDYFGGEGVNGTAATGEGNTNGVVQASANDTGMDVVS